jgi:MFS family permease
MPYKKSPYRWVALFSVVPALAVTQLCWLSFSAVSDAAGRFYHVSAFNIAFLSMSYMIVYIIVTVPASMLADRKGHRLSFLVGAAVTAVFGLMRGFFADQYIPAVIAQMGMAVAQPFIVNPITKLAASWFPVDERATASGIGSLAGYLGIVVAMVATPVLVDAYDMTGMLRVYGYVSLAAAAVVFAFLKEKPAEPAGPGGSTDSAFTFRDMLILRKNHNFFLLTIVLFCALGVFNAVLTCISDMLLPRGITANQSGMIGGMIIIAGLAGAVIIPLLSDRTHRRRPYLVASVAVSLAGLAGLLYFSNYPLLLASGAVAGFSLMGAGPLAFQFGTEIAYPVPEGSAYGILMGAGQISGILFIVLLYGLQSGSGSMQLPLTILVGCMVAALVLTAALKESELCSSS